MQKTNDTDSVDIRSAQRVQKTNMSCRFGNNPTEFPIYELSSHGFSFLCSNDLCFFSRGAIFDRISILNIEKLEVITASGTVVHTSQFDLKRIRIGVLFHKKQHGHQINGEIRVFRHIPRIPLHIEIQLKNDLSCKPIQGKILDFTALSSSIILNSPKDASQITKNDKITVKIYADDHTFFNGSASLISKRKKTGEIILKFTDQPLDVVKIERILNVKENSMSILDLLASFPSNKGIWNDFKALICDWRMYLSRCKQILDIEDSKNIYQSKEEKETLIKEIETLTLPPLHKFIDQLNTIVDKIPAKESLVYKEYFRENLDPFLRASQIVTSSIDKLQGYSGDFETIKLFFQNPYLGESLFAKFVNKFLHSLDAITAHKERVDFLYKELCSTYKTLDKDTSILVLGSGPAEELLRFIQNHRLTKPLRATLLDIDAYALADFTDRLQYVSQENFHSELINFDIISILKSNGEDPVTNTYQLSYCAGLLDYFSQTICKRLVKYLISHTTPGGTLILTNVHKNNSARHFMDYAGRWKIIHRDEKDMEDLIPAGYEWKFLYDSTNTNIFQKIYIPPK